GQMKELIERVVDRRLAVRRVRVPERNRPRRKRVPQEQEPRPERHRQVAHEEEPRAGEHARDRDDRDGESDERPDDRRQAPSFPHYWIGLPPDGAAWSLPLAPRELVICHSVPVVLMKKWRLPVVAEIGSAHA